MADIQNNEPVAYFYELTGVGKELVLDCNGEYARRLLEAGYTETPLYTRAAPPAMDREAVEKVTSAMLIGRSWMRHSPTCRAIVGEATEDGCRVDCSCGLADVLSSFDAAMFGLDPALFGFDPALSTLSADAIRQGEEVDNGYSADDAVDFVFNRLASKLGLADWQVVEGSEEWEGDVSATLHRLLVDAGIIDYETGAVATLATPASHASDGGKA